MQTPISIADYHEYFDNLWPVSKPLAKLLKTDGHGYLYDTGTNKIFQCDGIEFEILNNLLNMDFDVALKPLLSKYAESAVLKALYDICFLIEDKSILKTERDFQFVHSSLEELEIAVKEDLAMILLELTERCNLRCSYCIYDPHYFDKRNHGTRDMAITTARKAIEYLARCSGNKPQVGITFYGGEPLIQFQTIKECVAHARKILKNKETAFSITTNATLVTPEIARYLAMEGFSVRVSIDGPEEIHDEYRRDVSGNGSFGRTIHGLKCLLDAYGEKKEKVGFSMVFAPPFSSDRINRVTELWKKYPWIPEKIGVSMSYSEGFHPLVMSDESKHDKKFTLFDWAGRVFKEKHRAGLHANTIASSIIEREMVRYVQRNVYSGPLNKFSLNGCCVPGSRKQFVTVDGKLILCERIGLAPEIGDIDSGVDVNKLFDVYVKTYARESKPSCLNCWARQLCSVCFLHAFSGSAIDIRRKDRYCESARALTEKGLQLYCDLLEIKKDGLDYLMEWVVT